MTIQKLMIGASVGLTVAMVASPMGVSVWVACVSAFALAYAECRLLDLRMAKKWIGELQ